MWYNNGPLMAALGTAFGGILLAVVNKALGQGKDRFDIAAKIREELRTDLKRYQEEVTGYKNETSKLRTEVDTWRGKYFDLLRDQGKIIDSLTEDNEHLKRLLIEHGIELPNGK